MVFQALAGSMSAQKVPGIDAERLAGDGRSAIARKE
jgi:hypothetical protein